VCVIPSVTGELEGPSDVDMIILARLIYVLLSQLLLCGFFIYNYIVFFQTDKIVAGSVGIASAILAISFTLGKLLPTNSLLLLQDYVYFIYKHIRLWILFVTALWLVSIGWTYQMSNDVFGRLIYVKNLQESLARVAQDRISLPDPEVLATAFSEFPNRREVPFLLGRSSRLLYLAGRPDIFRTFQRTFFEKLEIDAVIQKLCRERKSHSRDDNITFLLSIIGEAYAPVAGLAPVEHQRDVQAIIDKFTAFHAALLDCRKGSFEAQFQFIKFEDTINDLSSSIGLSKPYDVDAELNAFELQLARPSQQAILEFWQSHGAQEYLDFQSYRLISALNEEYRHDPDSDLQRERVETIKRILSFYETLLLLRQGSLKSGEVEWSSPPYKLTLFYAFMLDANARTLVWEDVATLFTTSPSIKTAMSEFTNRRVFEEFRFPRGWYAGTPLDFSLNGSAVADKINSWLRTDW
jgi:hypothetical protein